MNATATAEQSAIGPIAAVLGRDVLATIVQQLKAQPDHWHRMNEQTQQKQVDQLRDKVRTIVANAVRVMIGGGGQFTSVGVELESLTFKDGLKGQFLIPKGAEGRHELADAVGGRVLIVLASPDAYLQRMEEVKEAADQLDLFGGDYDPSNDQPRYRRDEKEDRLSPARMGLQSWKDLMDKMKGGVITKEEAEKEYGGPLPEQPPVERTPTEDEQPDPLDLLDNIVGPCDVTHASIPSNIIITTAEDLPGLPDPIRLMEGETLRRAIERLVPGAKFDVGDYMSRAEFDELSAPLVFGAAQEEIDQRAELGVILERLFAFGYEISLGALQALEPEQLAQLKAWSFQCENTREPEVLPNPPDWLPKREPGKNQPDNNTKG